MGDIVRRSNIGINLIKLQGVLGIFYRDIVQLFYGLESGSFIDYIEDRASINIYNVNKYRVVKIKILVFLQYELEPFRGFTVFLTVGAVPSEVIVDLLVDIIIAKAFQYPVQFVCLWVSKAVIELIKFSNS